MLHPKTKKSPRFGDAQLNDGKASSFPARFLEGVQGKPHFPLKAVSLQYSPVLFILQIRR